ncbi:anti-sigma factor family protein, partial [Actinocorallia lasiicapitis]
MTVSPCLGESITALVDGELDHDARDLALSHLAGCDSCRAEATAFRALKKRLSVLTPPSAAPALLVRLFAMGDTAHLPLADLSAELLRRLSGPTLPKPSPFAPSFHPADARLKGFYAPAASYGLPPSGAEALRPPKLSSDALRPSDDLLDKLYALASSPDSGADDFHRVLADDVKESDSFLERLFAQPEAAAPGVPEPSFDAAPHSPFRPGGPEIGLPGAADLFAPPRPPVAPGGSDAFLQRLFAVAEPEG